MKLKNKKTGEVATLTLSSNGEELLLMKDNEMFTHNVKLSDLEDWQDYEEPKRHWIIDTMNDRVEGFDVPMTFNESIGNYFETKEEAELAVRKLMAWKRLKDKGYYFSGWKVDKLHFEVELRVKEYDFVTDEVKHDMNLLFGGEE